MPPDTVITARGLRRTYGRGAPAFEAVRGVDLDVVGGEIFALLGTNGAGKTSTLDVLEGLVAPSAGTVEVLGHDPRRERRVVRPELGIMLQAGGLPAELTVLETLEMWRGTCTHPTTSEAVLDMVGLGLDLIVDFAGFGETTAGAIRAVKVGGRVVQVGLGRTAATISTMELVGKSVTLVGSGGGQPENTAAVIAHMARGELTIEASAIGFDEIPAGLARLEAGGVVGRIVAEF